MKKIYSFVLMAAMLLVGANVWAGTRTVGIAQVNPDYNSVKAAVAASAPGDEIMLVSPVSENEPIWINKDLTLNVQGHTWTYSGTDAVAIGITSGSLTIKGNGEGQIIASNVGEDLIRIYGTYEKIDATKTDPHAQLVIENGVLIQSSKNAISIDVLRNGQGEKFGRSNSDFEYSCNFFHAAGSGYGVANGVKIEIAGAIKANKYGIKCNGTIRDGKEFANQAASWYTYEKGVTSYVATTNDEQYSPYIHIASTANIETMDHNSLKAVAVYASGYARWLIEGTCAGSSGVYVKSGDVDINGATISSNYEGTYDPILPTESTGSGVLGAGSAVAVESNKNYSGNMDVTIGGNSTLTASSGYALEESVTASTGTKVDAVTIEGATFIAPTTGSTGGAVIISQETAEAATGEDKTINVQIISAVVDGTLTVSGDDAQGTKLAELTSTSVVIPPASESEPTIIVPLDIKLTNDGYASFSAPINLYKATGKPGYAAFGIYTGTYNETLNVLQLHEVNYVQAGKGVILYRDPEASTAHCFFTTTAPDPFTPSAWTSDLKASADWDLNGNHESIYCLRNVGIGTMFYQYTGTEMPAFKAYLDFSQMNNNAPQRIRMVIAQEEQTEAIESVEAASVKAVKFVENGEILIRRGENVYNLQGQIVK